MVKMLIAASCLLVVAVGCGSDDGVLEGPAREANIVKQLVRDVADTAPGDPEAPDALPLVFVARTDSALPIDVQASVAADLVDEATIRFVDERTEAVDETLEGRPVRENGVLLVVGPVPPEGRVIEVDVERYRSVDDVQRSVVRLVWRDSTWGITAVEPVPMAAGGGPPPTASDGG